MITLYTKVAVTTSSQHYLKDIVDFCILLLADKSPIQRPYIIVNTSCVLWTLWSFGILDTALYFNLMLCQVTN